MAEQRRLSKREMRAALRPNEGERRKRKKTTDNRWWKVASQRKQVMMTGKLEG